MDIDELLNDIDNVMSDDEITLPNSEPIIEASPSHLKPFKQTIFNSNLNLLDDSSTAKPTQLLEEIDAFLTDSILISDEDEDTQINEIMDSNTIDIKSKICAQLRLISMTNLHDYCRQIRCLNCDHIVMLFHEYKWDNRSVDYLFFRLNFPNKEKLKQKLVKDSNYCCYCCQCQYININLSTSQPSSSKLKNTILAQWQCCGHI
eukprot:65701_1